MPEILPDMVGLFLSGWYLRANSMYRLLTMFSVTISFIVNPNIPSESLRFSPTPSGLNPLSLLGGGEGGKLFWLPLCWWRFRWGGVEYWEFGGFGSGSGSFRWGDRNLFSIIRSHLFLSSASFSQNFKEPIRSMCIASGFNLPKQSLDGMPSASMWNVFAGYKRVSVCTIAFLLVVRTPPGLLLWLTHAVNSCLGKKESSLLTTFPMNFSNLTVIRPVLSG